MSDDTKTYVAWVRNAQHAVACKMVHPDVSVVCYNSGVFEFVNSAGEPSIVKVVVMPNDNDFLDTKKRLRLLLMMPSVNLCGFETGIFDNNIVGGRPVEEHCFVIMQSRKLQTLESLFGTVPFATVAAKVVDLTISFLRKGIAYNDVKAENITVDLDGKYTFIDVENEGKSYGEFGVYASFYESLLTYADVSWATIDERDGHLSSLENTSDNIVFIIADFLRDMLYRYGSLVHPTASETAAFIVKCAVDSGAVGIACKTRIEKTVKLVIIVRDTFTIMHRDAVSLHDAFLSVKKADLGEKVKFALTLNDRPFCV